MLVVRQDGIGCKQLRIDECLGPDELSRDVELVLLDAPARPADIRGQQANQILEPSGSLFGVQEALRAGVFPSGRLGRVLFQVDVRTYLLRHVRNSVPAVIGAGCNGRLDGCERKSADHNSSGGGSSRGFKNVVHGSFGNQ